MLISSTVPAAMPKNTQVKQDSNPVVSTAEQYAKTASSRLLFTTPNAGGAPTQPQTPLPQPLAPGDVIFEQAPYLYGQSGWNGYTSDVGLTWLCQEDFSGLSDKIGGVVVYAIELIWQSGWYQGDPTGQSFNIMFYTDSGGAPGSLVEEFDGVPYDSLVAYDSCDGYGSGWAFTMTLPSSVDLDTGWIGIQSADTAPDGSVMLWITSPTGNNNARQSGGNIGVNLAYQLLAGGLPSEHDIAIKSINSPFSGMGQIFTPQITVKDKGNNSEDFNAEMQIQTQTVVPEQTIWQDNFDTGLSQWNVYDWSGYNLYWTAIGDYGGYYPTVPTYSEPYCAYLDGYNGYAYSAMQTANPISLPSGNVYLSFEQYYYYYSNYIYLYVSTDGYNWNYISTTYDYYYYNPGGQYTTGWGPAVNTNIYPYPTYFDLSSYAGQSIYLQLVGYSYYGCDMHIDNVRLYAPTSYGWSTEYDQTLSSHVDWNTSTQVNFPTWTPAAYQNPANENQDITYNVIAHAPLALDPNTGNNWKNTTIILHYPYLHDISVDSVTPNTDGNAKTQTVNVTISNKGQYRERDFFVHAVIGSEVQTYTYQTDFESGNGGYYQSYGYQWNYGAPPGGAHSGSYAWGIGMYGSYDAYGNDKLDSPSLTVPANARLTFWTKYNMEYYGYVGYDGGNVKISTNGGSTWSVLGTVGAPYDQTMYYNFGIPYEAGFTGISDWKQVTIDLSAYAGQNIMLRFHFGSYYGYHSGGYWFIDDVGIYQVGVNPEYDESAAVASWLNPGESRVLSYPAWTPDNLLNGKISGKFQYDILGTQYLSDSNPSNDQKAVAFKLTYTHDVAVKKITSPAIGKMDDTYVHIDDGICVNAVGITASGTWETAARFTTAELAPYAGQTIDQIRCHYYGYYPEGTPEPSLNGAVKFYDAGTASTPGALLYSEPFVSPSQVSWFYVNLTTPVSIDGSKDMWISTEWQNQQAGMFPAGCDAAPTSGKGDFAYINSAWSELGYGDWNIWARIGEAGGGGHPHPKPTVFVKLGTTVPIAGIVNNPGTFLETGMTCMADVWSFVSDPNGTGVYENSIGNIDLTPLGGEQTLAFGSYTFAEMGQYSVELNIPLAVDDKQGNNDKAVGVGCDGTAPVTTITLNPSAPNGANGWYVSNVVFTLKATDDMSGVGSIMYRIDGGSAVPYSSGVTISTDGNHTIGYYAVDKVGNTETEKSVAVHVDKTMPYIVLNKDILVNKIKYTAVVQDNMSLMDRVEFWIGPYLEFTQTMADPSGSQEAIWILSPVPHINVSVAAKAFDLAGNMAFALQDPLGLNLPVGQSQQAHSQTTTQD